MTTASVEAYKAIVGSAYDGTIKLPAFQRNWKWKPGQVALFFDSLRRGFPVGSFLFIEANSDINFSPRPFNGAMDTANVKKTVSLVLDGQQRITSGLALFKGSGPHHYFLDLRTIRRKAKEENVNTDDKDSIATFLDNLEVEDGYLRRRPATADPSTLLISNEMLWTGILDDDDEMIRAIETLCKNYPENADFYRYVVLRNFTPKEHNHIPITTIPGDVSIEAVSRIFSTLNSTGRMLTPFELVVATLYPDSIDLVQEVKLLREMFPYFSRIDKTGEILLQTIAIFAGISTKKSTLPKLLKPEMFNDYHYDAAKYIDLAGQFLTRRLGLGLDFSSELLIYPVFFSPLAYVMRELDTRNIDHVTRTTAERRIEQWYIGSLLDRRYQQSTHDKQAKDKDEILKWALGTDEDKPDWLSRVYVSGLSTSAIGSAKGILLRSMLNMRAIRDPLSREPVGVGAGKVVSARHHIFPTKGMQHVKGFESSRHTNNTPLNIMYTSQKTNSTFLNWSPCDQVEQSINMCGIDQAREIYLQHGITTVAFEILRKPEKHYEDFQNFLAEREAFFVGLLETWGFGRAMKAPGGEDADEDQEDDDDDEE